MFQQVPQRLDEADGGHEDKQGGGREEQPLPEVDLVGWPGARERARNAQKQRELLERALKINEREYGYILYIVYCI